MNWHYISTKITRKDGSVYWCVKEYYPKDDRLGAGWSEKPEIPYGESKKGLIRDLEMMLEDCKKHKTLEEKE